MTLTDQEKRMMQRMENSIAATPTQAQIEAAVKAIGPLLSVRSIYIDSEKVAIAAITAAAEMGEHTGMDEWQDAHNAKLQFAKYGPTGGQDDHIYMRGYVDGGKETKEATIERCAQMVNECLIKFQKQHDEDDQFSGIAVAALMADLVAAIRALKDKP